MVKYNSKTVQGFGINDADYCTSKSKRVNGKIVTLWTCPFHMKWVDMLRRVYSNDMPTYLECTITEEWHLFSNFKAWMETQDWEGKELDKDLLVKGNKEYGPDTCLFVDRKVNSFILERTNHRGEWPIGVHLHKRPKPFRAQCNSVETGKRTYLGSYDTPEEAHFAWLAFKLKQAHILAAEQTDPRVAQALVNRYENYLDASTGMEACEKAIQLLDMDRLEVEGCVKML